MFVQQSRRFKDNLIQFAILSFHRGNSIEKCLSVGVAV